MPLFDFLSAKKSLLSAGLFREMTDIHCHLLPGVDDGSQSEEETLQTLHSLSSIGIKRLYLTPHVMDSGEERYRERYKQIFKKLLTQIPDTIELKLAAEYMLDAYFMKHLETGLLTYADQKVLVETSYAAPPLNLEDILYEINLKGYIPVLAHPERYNYMAARDYTRLKNSGCLFQLNILSTVGYYGKRAYQKSHYLLQKGYYDFAGTDIHQLDKFERGIEAKVLKRKEIADIRKLIENNELLW